MAQPAIRSGNVRSHRRRPPRRFALVPWIIGALVVGLLAGGGVFAYQRLTKESCKGDITAQIIASAETSTILDNLARSWAGTKPAAGGTCLSVNVRTRDNAVMAQELGSDWDAKSSGAPPDVWVPDSTAWVRRASIASTAERMMPDLQPSLARTPAIIAMPKPMAEALGWPNADLSWQDLINKVATDPAGWAKYGKPNWGKFRFGMTDPLASTAGLLSLMAILDSDDDGEVTPAEEDTVYKLKQLRSVYTETTAQITGGLARADQQGEEAAMQYVSAFPALEQDVLNYNASNPTVPLVAVYPSNGSADADNPYLILDAPWADKSRQAAAKAFLTYARGPAGKQAFLDAGFRDANRTAGRPLLENPAFTPRIKTVPRAVLLPESVKQSMDTWTALTRPTNVLLVLDISGSMKEPVPGTGKTRMQLAKEAATSAVKLFDGDVTAGLWVFSSNLNGATDYKSLVPLGKVADRRDEMLTQIGKLTPTGDTGLYDTAAAAQQAVVNAYKPGATNLVVLMTDGKNDDPGGGLSLAQLQAKLSANAKTRTRVPIVTVGYGDDADFASLQDISRLSGGNLYTSKTAFDINEVLQTAIFGRV
jgi:Ca-activated chloride channel homolog